MVDAICVDDRAVMDDNVEVDRVLASMRGGLILDSAGRAERVSKLLKRISLESMALYRRAYLKAASSF